MAKIETTNKIFNETTIGKGTETKISNEETVNALAEDPKLMESVGSIEELMEKLEALE